MQPLHRKARADFPVRLASDYDSRGLTFSGVTLTGVDIFYRAVLQNAVVVHSNDGYRICTAICLGSFLIRTT